MSEPTSQTSFLNWVLLGLVAIPVLYVLSIGPIVYYVEKTHCGRIQWLDTFYAPLEWAYHNGFHELLDAYAGFWRKLAR